MWTGTPRAGRETPEREETGTPTGLVPHGGERGNFQPGRAALAPRHHLVCRPHGLLPERTVHARFLPERIPAPQAAAAELAALDRRSRSRAEREKARLAARRHGHRLGAGCKTLRTPVRGHGSAPQYR